MADPFFDPESDPTPQMSQPLQAGDGFMMPPPQAQVAPRAPMAQVPGPVSDDPKQKLLALAVLGFMLGAGKKSGLAQGAGHGLLQGQQRDDQQNLVRFQAQQQQERFQRAEQDRLDQQTRVENDRRDKMLGGWLQQIKTRVDKLPTKEAYDAEIEGYAKWMQSSGQFRGTTIDANWLRQAVPFHTPDVQPRAAALLDAWQKVEFNKQTMLKNPKALAHVTLQFDKDGDGHDEPVSLTELAAIAKRPFAVGEDGQIIDYPSGTGPTDKANADGILAGLVQQWQAEKGEDPRQNPRVMNTLRTQAMKQAKDATAQPQQTPTVVVSTLDAQGNPVTRIVHKTAGQEFRKPPSAVSQNRADSALAVKQTGEDIIRELSDPAVAAAIGPLMGRASSLRDLIGNPPPEFSHLAGQIESYALANMGVHGMRSSIGAQKIAEMLNGHHTPQSLIAAIQGLNGFSQHFLENQGRGGDTKTEDKQQKTYLATDPNAGRPLRGRGGKPQ